MEQADIMDPRIGAIYGQLAAQGPVADADAYGALLQKIREDELKKQALARGAAAVQAVRAGQAPVVVPQAPAPTTVTTTAMPGGTTGPLPQSAIEARQIISGKPQMNQPRQNIMASEMPEVQTEPTVMQERAGAQEESPKVPTPEESVKIATDIIQKSDAPEDVKKDQIEQVMSNPDLPQKLAMIAMAVAPTLVGYAAFGKKGAYLGAASTGKGLEAGTKQYIEDEQFKQKMDLEREKKQVSKEKKERDQWVSAGEDKYGNALILNKYTGEIKPAMVSQSGEQITRANVPVAKWNEQLGRMETTMKYESRPTEAFGEMTSPAVKLQSIKSGVESVRKKPGMKDFDIYIPDNDKAFIDKMQSLGHSIDNPRPPVVNGKPLYDQKTYDQYVASAQESIRKADEQMRSAASGAGKVDRAVSTTVSDKRYEKSLEEGIIKSKYIPLEAARTKQALYLDTDGTFIDSADGKTKEYVSLNKLKNVVNPALWQTYLRAVQQDESVVRPGESETAQSFMSIKQKFDGWLNYYGKLDSKMTNELAGDIKKLFQLNQSIRERELVIAMNNEFKNAQSLGKVRVLVERMPGDAKDIAREWAASKTIKEPIDSAQAKSMIASGKLKPGDIVISKNTGRKEILTRTNPIEFVPWRLFK